MVGQLVAGNPSSGMKSLAATASAGVVNGGGPKTTMTEISAAATTTDRVFETILNAFDLYSDLSAGLDSPIVRISFSTGTHL